MKEIHSIQAAIQHRPRLEKSIAYQQHLRQTIDRVDAFRKKHLSAADSKAVDFEEELELLRARLVE